MITLITGTPGAGKTAYAVAMLEAELRRAWRPVYVMGIPDLKLDHLVAPPVEQWTVEEPAPEDETLLESVFTFPEGSLIIIDEAQKVYRPRPMGQKVPGIVAAFEKHRHRGLDFWLITQNPTRIDSSVRGLIGKHLHLRSQWSGRTLYEWPEVHDPNSRTDRDTAVSRRYRLPRQVFGLYKSASLHVEQTRRIPLALYGFAGLLLFFLVGAYMMSERLGFSESEPEPVTTSPLKSGEAVQARQEAQPLPAAGLSAGAASGAAVGGTVAEWVPRIATRPETAPIYDGLRQVKALPVVAGCVALRDRCQCYTDQGTDAFLTVDQCREWLRSPPFNPWREQVEARAVPARSDGAAPGGGLDEG